MAEGNGAATELQVLVRAKYSCIAITSPEERRVERVIAAVADSLVGKAQSATGELIELPPYKVLFWSCTKGITDMGGEVIDGGALTLAKGLEFVRGHKERTIVVFRDAHHYLNDPAQQRAVRDTATALKKTLPTEARVVILLSPRLLLPKELEGDVHVMEWPLPTREELAAVLDEAIKHSPISVREEAQKVDRDTVVNAALGLTVEDAYGAIMRSLVKRKTVDPVVIGEEKKQLIAQTGCLEWMDGEPRGLASVGGLDIAKAFALERGQAFSQDAREYGLALPKGMLNFGAQGSGKTLFARALAGEWNLPGIRFNVASLFGPHLGETERAFREVRRVFKVLGRCVVLIDELEKAVGGDGTEVTGGTAGRLKGEFLGWLQDRDGAELFIVASANDIEGLARSCPEMLRKGRFDELFYVPLPFPGDRKAIFEVHIEKRNRRGKRPAFGDAIDLAALVKVTEGYSGAEIEAAVEQSMFVAFADDKRQVRTEDIVGEILRTKPLSKTAGDRLKNMEKWAEGKARWAATKPVAIDAGRAVEMAE